jgi:YidC/Oxa1 family membrane protein insertase
LAEFRNPNQSQGIGGSGGGGDLKTMFAVMTLVVAVLFGYQLFFKSKPDATQQQKQAQTQPQAQTQAASPASTPAVGPSVNGPQKPAAQSAPATPVISAATESETTIENELYRITFTNRGGQVKHWILKGYYDSRGKPADPKSHENDLDLVQPQAAEKFGYPLSLFTYEPALNTQLTQALYQVTSSAASTTGTLVAPQTLTFHYQANGLDVVKSIHFDSSYVVTIEAQVKRNGQPVRSLIQWPSGFGDQEEFIPSSARGSRKASAVSASVFAWSVDGKQDYEAAGKVSGNATLEGDYEYAAASDLYFTAAFLPDAPNRATVVTLHNAIDLNDSTTTSKHLVDVLGLAVGDTSGFTRARLYAGPKQMEILDSIHAHSADGSTNGPNLRSLIQFGYLKYLSEPLYFALRFLYEHGISNWGWAIIIITAIFNLLMLPTRFMMMRSSLKMARIQPKVNAIKARFAHLKATDPRKADMNAEMMALYKQEGVNMYGGCLPMLLQTPLFFALYRLLANVIELRQAHWGWLTDLSVVDPLYILPAIIIICMFVTQLITPAPGMDPSQRRMMAFMMPIVMGFTLSHFPSGLSVYWATSNVMNLLIQLGINRSPIGRELRELAARRAAKKPGGSKIVQGKR